MIELTGFDFVQTNCVKGFELFNTLLGHTALSSNPIRLENPLVYMVTWCCFSHLFSSPVLQSHNPLQWIILLPYCTPYFFSLGFPHCSGKMLPNEHRWTFLADRLAWHHLQAPVRFDCLNWWAGRICVHNLCSQLMFDYFRFRLVTTLWQPTQLPSHPALSGELFEACLNNYDEWKCFRSVYKHLLPLWGTIISWYLNLNFSISYFRIPSKHAFLNRKRLDCAVSVRCGLSDCYTMEMAAVLMLQIWI